MKTFRYIKLFLIVSLITACAKEPSSAVLEAGSTNISSVAPKMDLANGPIDLDVLDSYVLVRKDYPNGCMGSMVDANKLVVSLSRVDGRRVSFASLQMLAHSITVSHEVGFLMAWNDGSRPTATGYALGMNPFLDATNEITFDLDTVGSKFVSFFLLQTSRGISLDNLLAVLSEIEESGVSAELSYREECF